MKKDDVSLKRILFKKGKIQGLNRVVIPKELLQNMDLKEGDDIALYFDHYNSSIVLKKDEGLK